MFIVSGEYRLATKWTFFFLLAASQCLSDSENSYRVLTLVSNTVAELVIVRGGYSQNLRQSMVCDVVGNGRRNEQIILLAVGRDQSLAAILGTNQTIKINPGDLVIPKLASIKTLINSKDRD